MLTVLFWVIAGVGTVLVVLKWLLVDTTMYTRRPDLRGRVAVVTGTAPSGIGGPTAAALAECGARVFLANRDAARSEAQARALSAQYPNARVEHVNCDLADLSSAAACADEVRRRLGPDGAVDIVVANAGVMQCPLMASKQGYELQYATNHLGHFVLIANLLPAMLKRASEPRVVVVSSVAHKFAKTLDLTTVRADACVGRYGGMRMYARSKLANVLVASELARRFGGGENRLHAYSLMPGNINTQLGRWWPKAALFLAKPLLWALQKTVVQGAQTTLLCALAPVEELENGGYFEDVHLSRASALAQDPAVAQQLWETTLVQVDAFLTPDARNILQQ